MPHPGAVLLYHFNSMLTLKQLRDDPEYVIRKLAVKNFDARAIVER